MVTTAFQTPFCAVVHKEVEKQYSDRPHVCTSFGTNVSSEIGPFYYAACTIEKTAAAAAVFDGRPNLALRGSRVLSALSHMTAY